MIKFITVAAMIVCCVAAQKYNPKPAYPKPSYPEPAYPKPAYPEPAYKKPAYPEPAYPKASYGQVPPLPPFGAAAEHPKYGAGYGGDKYGGEKVYAYRYESTTHGPNSIDSAYAYKVDGQEVQVAKQDAHYSKGYNKY